MQVPSEARNVRAPGAGFTDSCEPSGEGFRNQTWVLCKHGQYMILATEASLQATSLGVLEGLSHRT